MISTSIKRLITFSIFVFLLASCQKDYLLELENFVTDEFPSLKSATTSKKFIVITKSETIPDGFKKKLGKYGEIVQAIPEIGILIVKSTNSDFEKKTGKLKDVQSVVPDLITQWIEPVNYKTTANPASIGVDEPGFVLQWGLDAINAPEAWNAGYTGVGTRVFILDSGIDPLHPDLAPNLNTGLCTSFVPGELYDDNSGPEASHGTHVAGIIAAADNTYGIIGVAPNTEIVAVKVLSGVDGAGAFGGIIAGIVYAANHKADVINMSLGTAINKNGFILDENNEWIKIPAVWIQRLKIAFKRAIDYAEKNGALIVTSAGNEGINADGNGSMIFLPADFEKVICVSATAPYNWFGNQQTYLDIPASYTQYGKSLIDIAAPGGDFDSYNYVEPSYEFYYFDMILSTVPGGNFAFGAGTSMASPHVAGVAALIIDKHNGYITPQKVKKLLLKTADKIDGNGQSAFLGKGRVNAFRAVTE